MGRKNKKNPKRVENELGSVWEVIPGEGKSFSIRRSVRGYGETFEERQARMTEGFKSSGYHKTKGQKGGRKGGKAQAIESSYRDY